VVSGNYVVRGGAAQRRGRPDIPLDPVTSAFVRGVTEPTLSNSGTGINGGPTLTAYTGPSAGGLLIITTANAIYSDLDFGDTFIDIRAANVVIRNCKFRNLTHTGGNYVISCLQSSCVNATIQFCEIRNFNQSAWAVGGIGGHDFTLDRSIIAGFSDAVDPATIAGAPAGTNPNVSLTCNFLGELGWWWNSVKGIVHPTDFTTHNDVVQDQGGPGLVIYGNSLRAYYSTTVGTGTPGSGSDNTGNPTGSSEPTYAEGVSSRNSLIEPYGATPTTRVGGTLSVLMCNHTRGVPLSITFTDNWCYGGGVMVNARDSFAGDLGTFERNRVKSDQRYTVGSSPARGQAFVIATAITTTSFPTTGANSNTWMDTGLAVPRITV
jgi:hypothetical protein